MRAVYVVCLLAACNVPITKFTGTGDGGGGDGNSGTPAMLSATPSGDLALGTVVIGQTSAKTAVTVSNSGDQSSGPITLSFDDMTLGFAVVDDMCSNVSLAGHNSCTFAMTFTPNNGAAVQTNIKATAAPGGQVMKVLFGTGLIQGQVDITETGYDFVTNGLGAAAKTKVFTVRNLGQSQLGTPVPSTSGGDPSYSIASTTCTAPLNQADTCTVTVSFLPTTVGQKGGSLTVTSTPGGQDAASLSGLAFAHVALAPQGTGFGRVTSSVQPGINCPGTCNADFTSSPIVLNAAADVGSSFATWATDCTGTTSSCTLDLTGPKSVGASFTINAYPVTISFTSNNPGTNAFTSSPAGLTCSGGTCQGSFNYMQPVTITAQPDNVNGRFTAWSTNSILCPGSTSPSCAFTMPAQAQSGVATFDWFASMTILMNKGDTGFPTATTQANATDGSISCTNTTTLAGVCTAHYTRGSTVTLRYMGNPSTTWTSCKGGTLLKFLQAYSGGECAPPAGIICSNSSCPGVETCSYTFTNPVDAVSSYDVACEN
jgi:hypothetical protein